MAIYDGDDRICATAQNLGVVEVYASGRKSDGITIESLGLGFPILDNNIVSLAVSADSISTIAWATSATTSASTSWIDVVRSSSRSSSSSSPSPSTTRATIGPRTRAGTRA
ncbi:hypothetical protein M7I_3901 [Glarea lozoyensis 74030]|uniref:Uncharacterized protein n=1 Tax=Glarea lozoyensis (strain ATCC 74030 / MF5533) TaxID=1104152 RepID=H0EMQ8_GLAL7|nr:hypothetical protein M7I_3901 [Glarea lozoyensis 74030]